MFKNGNEMKIDRKINNTMTTNHVQRLSHIFFWLKMKKKVFVLFSRSTLFIRSLFIMRFSLFFVSLNSLFLCISNRNSFTHSMSFIFDRWLQQLFSFVGFGFVFAQKSRVLLLSSLHYHIVECVNFNQWKLLFH